MSDFTLYIGNRAYSSWSLRGWLACKLAGIAFAEKVHDMAAADWPDFVQAASPTAKVPVLRHGSVVVWESIAIGDYLADLFPKAGLWPEEPAARAQARAMSAEMHAGFIGLRTSMWMNMRRHFPGRGRTPAALADVARIVALWDETRQRFGTGGPYLFGQRFTLADAMYAPVVSRFVTWEPELPASAKAYVAAAWDQPFMVEWRKAADAEPWTIAKYETPGP
jgi:glutathione S-transferase